MTAIKFGPGFRLGGEDLTDRLESSRVELEEDCVRVYLVLRGATVSRGADGATEIGFQE